MLVSVLALVAYAVGSLVWLRRDPAQRSAAAALVGAELWTLLVGVAAMVAFRWRIFGVMQLFAWGLFLVGPLWLLGLAVVLDGRRRVAAAVLAALLAAIGVDAFVIEPRWLEVSHLQVESEEIRQPLTIALIADLQTDDPGPWEQEALRRALDAKPDLVVFAGDFVHLEPGAPREAEQGALNAILRALPFEDVPLGAWAVNGDVEVKGWETIFDGTGITAASKSTTVTTGPLALTLLRAEDSRADSPPVPVTPGFHVVVGHSPDFAMTRPPADLLLAGHTHGGQVQLPGFGPLMTLSKVPRAWASGHTALPWGGDLVVSRGIGMERREAPRLRFLCRPEVVLIELVPATSRSGTVADAPPPGG